MTTKSIETLTTVLGGGAFFALFLFALISTEAPLV